MLKKFFILCLSFFLISSVNSVWAGETSASPEGLQNFNKSVIYEQGRYLDVDENAWYGVHHEGCIKEVTELGIMQGDGDGKFRPEESLSLGEIVKIAVVLHCIYNREPVPGNATNGDPWYQNYVDYARNHQILAEHDELAFHEYANRQETARLIRKSLPAEAFKQINMIESLPMGGPIPKRDNLDYFVGDDLHCISDLYKAGILTGDPETHYYRPSDMLTRSEAAAIIVRAVWPNHRLSFSVSSDYLIQSRRELALANLDNEKWIDGFTTTRTELDHFSGDSVYKDTVIGGSMKDYPDSNSLDNSYFEMMREFEFGQIIYRYYTNAPDTIEIECISITDKNTSPACLQNGISVGSTKSEVSYAMKKAKDCISIFEDEYHYCYYDPVNDNMLSTRLLFVYSEFDDRIERINIYSSLLSVSI